LRKRYILELYGFADKQRKTLLKFSLLRRNSRDQVTKDAMWLVRVPDCVHEMCNSSLSLCRFFTSNALSLKQRSSTIGGNVLVNRSRCTVKIVVFFLMVFFSLPLVFLQYIETFLSLWSFFF